MYGDVIFGVYRSVLSLSGELEVDLTVGTEMDQPNGKFESTINIIKDFGRRGSSKIWWITTLHFTIHG
jgi:hypothetical protein